VLHLLQSTFSPSSTTRSSTASLARSTPRVRSSSTPCFPLLPAPPLRQPPLPQLSSPLSLPRNPLPPYPATSGTKPPTPRLPLQFTISAKAKAHQNSLPPSHLLFSLPSSFFPQSFESVLRILRPPTPDTTELPLFVRDSRTERGYVLSLSSAPLPPPSSSLSLPFPHLSPPSSSSRSQINPAVEAAQAAKTKTA